VTLMAEHKWLRLTGWVNNDRGSSGATDEFQEGLFNDATFSELLPRFQGATAVIVLCTVSVLILLRVPTPADAQGDHWTAQGLYGPFTEQTHDSYLLTTGLGTPTIYAELKALVRGKGRSKVTSEFPFHTTLLQCAHGIERVTRRRHSSQVFVFVELCAVCFVRFWVPH
jgi:hypothetical protein